MTCCFLHLWMPTLTKRAKPIGWDGSKPLYYGEEHWGVMLRGRLVCEPMFADYKSAMNYIELLEHEVHGTDPEIFSGELVISP